jgi:transposase
MRCKERGFPALFLPKFHPELNPIEQCWCRTKLMYRDSPLSSKVDVMHSYVVDTLDTISLKHIRQ